MSLGKQTDGSNSPPPLPTEIDQTAGRYLLGIHHLAGQDESRVSTGDLREYLEVTPASVTEMIGKLDDRGFVDYEKYRGVTLTDRGSEVARRLAWRHCVVTNFFGKTLDTNLDDLTSYEIGFTLPEQGLTRLSDLIHHPCTESCPETGQDYDGCLI